MDKRVAARGVFWTLSRGENYFFVPCVRFGSRLQGVFFFSFFFLALPGLVGRSRPGPLRATATRFSGHWAIRTCDPANHCSVDNAPIATTRSPQVIGGRAWKNTPAQTEIVIFFGRFSVVSGHTLVELNTSSGI